MDILISSNLERLLYHITDGDTLQIKNWMEELTLNGQYGIGEKYLENLKNTFWADWVDDKETLEKITGVFKEYQYVADPHTAGAWQVGERYRQQTGDMTPQIIVSTASPFKFNESVLAAIGDSKNLGKKDEFSMLYELAKVSGWTVPPALAALEKAPVCHNIIGDKEEMPIIIKKILK
jgi:threonine synthase